jgi:hypothetical protein
MTAQLKRKYDEDGGEHKAHHDREQEEKDLDEGLEETFPGSDPVSITQPVPEPSRSKKERHPWRH